MEQGTLANTKVIAQSSACMKALVKKSTTTNQRKEGWKVHSVGYNAVASFIVIHLAAVASEICEISRDSLKNSNW